MLPTVFKTFLHFIRPENEPRPAQVAHGHRDGIDQIVVLGLREAHALADHLVGPSLIGAVYQSFLEQVLHRVQA